MLLVAVAAVLAAVSSDVAVPPAAPTGLMTEYQGGLALGAPATPLLSWIVSPCGGSSYAVQAAYRVVVAEETFTPSGGSQHATV
jgi:hypothetical protein